MRLRDSVRHAREQAGTPGDGCHRARRGRVAEYENEQHATLLIVPSDRTERIEEAKGPAEQRDDEATDNGHRPCLKQKRPQAKNDRVRNR